MRKHDSVLRLCVAGLAALALGILFAGCQTSTLAPTAPVPDLGQELQAHPQPKSGASSHVVSGLEAQTVAHCPPKEAPTAEINWVATTIPDPAGSMTFEIHGSVGGTFTYGRYQLFFPPNAVDGDGEVTMTVPNGNSVGCDFHISPEPLNGFNKPVVFTISTQGTNDGAFLPDETTIYWYEGDDKWMDMEGRYSKYTGKLTAKLWHFSKYRAGW